jgi:hypothetical protein
LGELEHAEQPHIVIDKGVVTSAVFVGYTDGDVSVAVDSYKSGSLRLESQLAVHNQVEFRYEVGEKVHAPDAGMPGLNGCCKGIHVFTNKAAALEYASLMAVASTCLTDSAPKSSQGRLLDERSLVLTDVTGVDLDVDNLQPWWPWNNMDFTPQDDCPCCGARLAGTLTYKVLDCGHVLCSRCRHLVHETRSCGICHATAIRVEEINALPW